MSVVTHTKNTGSAGQLVVKDDGLYLDFYIKGSPTQVLYQVPYNYTVGTFTEPWRAYATLQKNDLQYVMRLHVETTAYVTFRLGETNSDIGGPTEFTVLAPRAVSGQGYNVTIRDGILNRRAVPYVKDNDEWKPAEPWVKVAGVWRPVI